MLDPKDKPTHQRVADEVQTSFSASQKNLILGLDMYLKTGYSSAGQFSYVQLFMVRFVMLQSPNSSH